jgi:hypothetical protein
MLILEILKLVGRDNIMLIRIKEFIFDISKVDVIEFSHFEYEENTTIFTINKREYDYKFENKDEFSKTKEFLLSMCPDITTEEGRNGFLTAIRQVAEAQGFRRDSIEKENPKSAKYKTDIGENYFKTKSKTDIEKK